MNRDWMYNRGLNRRINPLFLKGVDTFIEFATSQPSFMSGDEIRCPCAKLCRNSKFKNVDTVRLHLLKHGFESNYKVWVYHGEELRSVVHDDAHLFNDGGASNQYRDMVMDAAGPSFVDVVEDIDDVEEAPNFEARKFFDMLNAADNELWPGCKNHTQLSIVARLVNLKSENNISEKCFGQIAELMKEIVPEHNLVPDNFYKTKRLLSGMGLPVQKIDCCLNNCMLFWKDKGELEECSICRSPRFQMRKRKKVAVKRMYYFPLTPRLQRLYASNATASEMCWHASSVEDGTMRHPADSPTWKHLNVTFPEFASEPRNVRLGLSTNGFQPFGSGKQYSSWPVILTPYNLPPWMCMKEQYMFLTVLVPGPQNPKDKLDVFLQPLIEELCHLWNVGEPTYDVSKNQNFQMRAAVLWTISDFPAYSMLSGWSTDGRLACPHCGDYTDAFTLSCSGKQSWFDNHRKFLPTDHPFRFNKMAFLKNKEVIKGPPEIRSGIDILNEIDELGLKKVTEPNNNASISKAKGCGWKKRSIFWDLPYWSSLLIRHNLDVMHIEKNVFNNIFNTVLNVKRKTKDNVKSRKELNQYCARPELSCNAHGQYPKACYTLDKREINVLFEWVRELKFPDGYVSNLSRCVNMKKLKMFGMKSHDCHVFMQRILPIAFRELLPANVWKAITELSLFFRDLCSRNINIDDLDTLHANISVILCQLERVFPPSFFDSMEHLPMHLADEAILAGPVQYRWMYPFERYLGKLNKTIGNKTRVEGSICNAYLAQEASAFCSFYFEDHINTRYINVPRNFERRCEDNVAMISLFKQSGRPFGKVKQRFLTEVEYNVIRTYVLQNCPEVDEYVLAFVAELQATHPNISSAEIASRVNSDFGNWFYTYARNNLNGYMKDFARGPLRVVNIYPAYFVNGYKFNTIEYGAHMATMNSGVCVKGANMGSDEINYYGRLIEVVEVEYPGLPLKKTTLFKCEWFDTSSEGTQIHPTYKMVSINHRKRYSGDDVFVLATQSIQVFYCSYPSLNQNKRDWWAVCKTQARPKVHVPEASFSISPPLQEDDLGYVPEVIIDDFDQPTNASDGHLIDIEDDVDEDDVDDDIELSDEDDVYWDEVMEETVQKQWTAKAAVRYRDFMAKGKRVRPSGRPDYIPELAWPIWCQYWDSPQGQAVSPRAKKNRLSEPFGPGIGVITHRGGSKSASSHAATFAAERGVSVNETLLETFQRLHRIEGRYTDPKYAMIGAEVERIATERSQPLPDGTPTPAVDMNAIFLEVAANAEKGCVFGLGSLYNSTHQPAASSSWDSSCSSNPQAKKFELLEKELQETRGMIEQQHRMIEQQQRMLLRIHRHIPNLDDDEVDGSEPPPL